MKLSQYLSVAVLALFVISSNISALKKNRYLRDNSGPYLGEKPPGTKAVIFAPGIISTELHDDAVPAFSPDGKEVFFRIVFKKEGKYFGKIFHTKEENGKWLVPEETEFFKKMNKQFHGGAIFSHDGNRLYNTFSDFKDGKFNLDIALIQKQGQVWNKAALLNSINSSFNESYFFESEDGYLYWSSEKMRNDPKPGFYRTSVSSGYSNKELVTDFPDNAIVTYISSNNKFAFLTMRTEENSYDLFICFKLNDGSWSNPINMGPNVNSEQMEKQAVLSHDGKYIFFVSARKGEGTQPLKLWNSEYFENLEDIFRADIYWVSAGIIDKLNPENK